MPRRDPSGLLRVLARWITAVRTGLPLGAVILGSLVLLGSPCSWGASGLAERALAVHLASTSKQVFVNDFSRILTSPASDGAWAAFRNRVFDEAFYVGPLSLTKRPWEQVRALSRRGAFQWEIHSNCVDTSWSHPVPDVLWASFGFLQDADLEEIGSAEKIDELRCIDGVLVQTLAGVRVPSLPEPGPEWRGFLDVLEAMKLDSYVIREGSVEAGRRSPPIDWSRWPENLRESFLKAYPQLDPNYKVEGYNYDVFAAGIGRDAKGPFLGFVLHYANPSQMKEEVERLKAIHLRLVFRNTSSFPMREMYRIEDAEVQTRGNVIFGKYYQQESVPNRIWYQIWIRGDSYF